MGSKSSTTTVNAVGDKSKELQDLEKSFYGAINPIVSAYTQPLNSSPGNFGNISVKPAVIRDNQTLKPVVPQPYDNNSLMGQLFNDATQKQYAANGRYDDLMKQAPGIADKAMAENDWWYDKAKGAYGQAENLLSTAQSNVNYSSSANKWYDDYARDMLGRSRTLLDTGEIPKPILDAMQAAMTDATSKSVGSQMSDLASRGVINSSVANKGFSDMSRSVSDSMQAGYLDAFKTMLGGYNESASTAGSTGKQLADTYLNIASSANDTMRNAIGLGDSYGKTGSMRTGDLLGMWDMNLKERDQIMKDIPGYYNNAVAPMMPAFGFLQQMQQDHWNSDKKDTIVKQGK